jgi:hypothetical protein
MEKQKQKSKKRRAIVILVLLIGVLFISIGYATLSTIVGINGSSIGVSKTVWKVFFKSVDDDKTGNIAPETAATISSDKKEITFAVNLEELGDTYTFDAVIENQSSYDATLTSDPVLVIKKGNETATLPDYISYTVKDSEGNEVAEGFSLNKRSEKTVTVSISYNESDVLPEDDETFTLSYSMTFTSV